MIFPSRNSRNTAKKAFICPPAGMDPKGTAKVPTHSTSRPVAVSYLLLYLIHLPGHDLFASFRLLGRSQISPLAEGRQEVREFLQDYIGGKKTAQRCPCFARPRACKYLRAISRLPAATSIFASTNGGSPPPVAVPSTGLSFSSVRADAFVSIFSGLGGFLPGRFPR